MTMLRTFVLGIAAGTLTWTWQVRAADTAPAANPAPAAATAKPAAADVETDDPVLAAAIAETEKARANPGPLAPIKVEPDNIKLGSMMDGESRSSLFKVTNTSTDKSLKIALVRAGCSCTTVGNYVGQVIEPGKSVEIKFDLDAGKVAEGDFKRAVLVVFDGGYAPLPLRFEGTMKRVIGFKPGKTLNFGTVATTTSAWTQTVEITGNLPDGKRLVLGQPEHPKYEMTLTEKAPSQYSLQIKPKLPQATGRVRDSIKIPIKEPVGTKELVVQVSGTVGGRLLVQPDRLLFDNKTYSAPETRTVVLARHEIRKNAFTNRNAAAAKATPAEPTPVPDPGKVKIEAVEGITCSGASLKEGKLVVSLTFAPALLNQKEFTPIKILVPEYQPATVWFRKLTPEPPGAKEADDAEP